MTERTKELKNKSVGEWINDEWMNEPVKGELSDWEDEKLVERLNK